MPERSSFYTGKNFEDVKKMLSELGFSNVTVKPMNDLDKVKIFENRVKEVSINGVTFFQKMILLTFLQK